MIKSGTLVKIETTNGGECVVRLTAEYRPTYPVFVERVEGGAFVILADRLKSIRPVEPIDPMDPRLQAAYDAVFERMERTISANISARYVRASEAVYECTDSDVLIACVVDELKIAA